MAATLEGYGSHMFWGVHAAPYLQAEGLDANTLESPDWTWNGKADKVS